jgi:hypothetical protein
MFTLATEGAEDKKPRIANILYKSVSLGRLVHDTETAWEQDHCHE